MPSINCTSCIYPRQMVKDGFDRGRPRYRCPMCGTRREPPELQASPRGIYKSDRLATVGELLQQGYGIRATARMLQLQPTTVRKYKKIVLPSMAILCPCGKPSGHNGWCKWRVSLSPARQEYYAKCAALSAVSLARVRPRLEPVLTTWPFVRSFDNDDYALLKAVNDLVPRSVPEHVRADLCQDILMEIVSGEVALESVPLRMKEYTRNAYRFAPSKFGPKSLDSFIYGNEGRTLADILEG